MGLENRLGIYLKELDGALKKLPKEERGRALEIYQYGTESSFSENYPNVVQAPEHTDVERKYNIFFELGKYLGNQFGVMEFEYVRDLLFKAIEKRKAKVSRKGFFDIFRFLRK